MLLARGIARQLYSLRGLQIGLILSYLGVWFTFGVLYWRAADREFIFQRDLRLSAQTAAFRRSLPVPMQKLDWLLDGLVKIDDEGLFLTGCSESRLFCGGSSNKPLGYYWGRFYEVML